LAKIARKGGKKMRATRKLGKARQKKRTRRFDDEKGKN
jgi:hypothetical protein